MNPFKKILTATLAASLTLTLCSCQLSKILPSATEETTTGELITFTLPTTAPTAEPTEPMDLASADLTPYITLGTYKGLTATMSVTPLSDAEFETELTAYLNSTPVYEKVTDRAAVEGDTVIVDYVGTMDGVAFSGGTAQNQSVTISENSGYIPGFAEGLIGAMPGTTVAVDVTFPENYYEDMAGKAAVFTFTVHYIQGEAITPEATDAFITLFTDGAFTSIAEFRTYYREYLDATAESEAYTAALESLWSQAIANATIHSLPEQHVQYYYDTYKAQYEQLAQAYGVTMDQLGITEETLQSTAEDLTRQDLVFYALAQAESITLTDEEYAKRLSELAAQYGDTEANLVAYYGEDYLRDVFLYDEVQSMLYDNANITE